MATALPPNSSDRPSVDTQYRKPKADLYTLLLAIALVAILIGSLFLFLYNSAYKGSGTTAMIVGTWRNFPSLARFLG
jgi:hypothetical protein